MRRKWRRIEIGLRVFIALDLLPTSARGPRSAEASSIGTGAVLAKRCRRTHIAAMSYASLRDFIDRLEAAGRLVRVDAPVSPYLEMTEIQTRLLAEGGPAALFENVTRPAGGTYEMPVLVNLFGTLERVA